MAVAPTFPGVYIEEAPSGVRTITGVATSITACIGRALRGPVQEPVTVNSFGDFERIFGGLSTDSAMSFAVRDFFLNGGGQGLVVRLHRNATQATINLPTGAAAPNDVLPLLAASHGAWGNKLQVTVDYQTKDQANTKLFNLTAVETGGATEKHLNVSIDPADSRFLPRVLDQASVLVRVARDNTGTPILPNVRPTAATTGATAN